MGVPGRTCTWLKSDVATAGGNSAGGGPELIDPDATGEGRLRTGYGWRGSRANNLLGCDGRCGIYGVGRATLRHPETCAQGAKTGVQTGLLVDLKPARRNSSAVRCRRGHRACEILCIDNVRLAQWMGMPGRAGGRLFSRSMRTEPVKHSAGPLADACVPGWMSFTGVAFAFVPLYFCASFPGRLQNQHAPVQINHQWAKKT